MSKKRRIWAILGGTIVLLGGGFMLSEPGRAILDIWRTGAIQDALKPVEMRTYQGDTASNLRAMHTAMMLYHDSEERFPDSSGWMNAIEPRLQVGDMDATEAAKKMRRPGLAEGADAYGYAMNAAASGKYKDDVGNPSTVLIFESEDTGRNASSTPPGTALGISIDGSLRKPSASR